MDPKATRAATEVVLATVFIYSTGFGVVMPCPASSSNLAKA
jgi:hypothetical protein